MGGGGKAKNLEKSAYGENRIRVHTVVQTLKSSLNAAFILLISFALSLYETGRIKRPDFLCVA